MAIADGGLALGRSRGSGRMRRARRKREGRLLFGLMLLFLCLGVFGIARWRRRRRWIGKRRKALCWKGKQEGKKHE